MIKGFHDTTRQLLRISGGDRVKFLQDLVTNNVSELSTAPVYTALLSPQGKYLFDFFLISDADAILLDVAEDRAATLAQRLTMYRLRADVQIEAAETQVWRGIGDMPTGAVADPRSDAMGWRLYVHDAPECEPLDPMLFDAVRVENVIPESGKELVVDQTYILEAGFERLNGVDFRKGCYVGQEITARMKHKTELKKGLVKVLVDGDAPECGSEITANGKPAGTLFTVAGGIGLAHLRFDRAQGAMECAGAALRLA